MNLLLTEDIVSFKQFRYLIHFYSSIIIKKWNTKQKKHKFYRTYSSPTYSLLIWSKISWKEILDIL
jgi:hypothetical protein